MRGKSLVITLAGCLTVNTPLSAQFHARLDLSSSNRYVRNGLSRAAGLLVQSSMTTGFRFDRLSINGGIVRHLELDQVRSGELSELGAGQGRVGEDDFWAGAAFDAARLHFRSGVIRYVFRGETPQGAAGLLRNSTEIYAAVGAKSTYLYPTLEAWWDVDQVRGAFLKASAASPVIGWPYAPFLFISITGELGMNLGQGRDPARPGDLANYVDRGLTHAGLGLNVLRRLKHWDSVGSASLSVDWTGQLNLDEATRFDGFGRSINQSSWVSVGVTVVLGGEARVLR